MYFRAFLCFSFQIYLYCNSWSLFQPAFCVVWCCVCVSTPGQRVSFDHSNQAGDGDTCIASPSTKLAIHGEDISSGRGTDVPAFNTMTPLVHPAAVLCFHGSSCYCPSNTGSSATCSRREFFAARHRSHVTNFFVKTSTHLRTLHLAVPSPFLTWELS